MKRWYFFIWFYKRLQEFKRKPLIDLPVSLITPLSPTAVLVLRVHHCSFYTRFFTYLFFLNSSIKEQGQAQLQTAGLRVELIRHITSDPIECD